MKHPGTFVASAMLLVLLFVAVGYVIGAQDYQRTNCELVGMDIVKIGACCPGGSHWKCCCDDCEGRYETYLCPGGVTVYDVWCCSL